MKLSIVMAYYNRKFQLINTLKTIANSKSKKDIEVIIVDDASDEDNRIDKLMNYCGLKIKLIRIDSYQKKWHNSCIPFNVGFEEANSDIIIIQCPECLYVGDVVDYAINNVKDNTYIAFGCYSADKTKSTLINAINLNAEGYDEAIIGTLRPFNNTHPSKDCENGWYCHPIYNPCAHHFCSAMTKKYLDELGGFDERYAGGLAYEDMEFIRRIRGRGMNVQMTEHPFVVHQAHTPTDYAGNQQLFNRNRELYAYNKI